MRGFLFTVFAAIKTQSNRGTLPACRQNGCVEKSPRLSFRSLLPAVRSSARTVPQKSVAQSHPAELCPACQLPRLFAAKVRPLVPPFPRNNAQKAKCKSIAA
jgi:hypothetical protein